MSDVLKKHSRLFQKHLIAWCYLGRHILRSMMVRLVLSPGHHQNSPEVQLLSYFATFLCICHSLGNPIRPTWTAQGRSRNRSGTCPSKSCKRQTLAYLTDYLKVKVATDARYITKLGWFFRFWLIQRYSFTMGKWQILYLRTRYRSKLGWFFWFVPIHVTIRRNFDGP